MATTQTTPCLFCDTPMIGVHCKQICPNCGYKEDCSDLFPQCAYEMPAPPHRHLTSEPAGQESGADNGSFYNGRPA